MGTFLAFHVAFGMFIQGITSAGNTLVEVVDSFAKLRLIQPLLEAQPEVDATKADPGRIAGRLELRDVSFRYQSGGPLIFAGVNIQAEPGEFIAIVGASGSGKSTILRLRLGFETPESGIITVDDHELYTLEVTAVRRQMGVVLQTRRINVGSIFDSITLGHRATRDEAWQAARDVGFAEDIEHGLTFNYADAHDGWSGAPQLFWLAMAFDQSEYAAAQLPFAMKRPSPLDLLWGAAWLARGSKHDALPLDRHFSGVSVVTMRSAWNDPTAAFVGFKGGDSRVNHGQLDLGSFVLDEGGVRWAIDLGPDDYNIPGYFGKQRWEYYRNMTEGHNTLVINGKNQSTTATASIIHFGTTAEDAEAVADLSKAYPDVKRVWRGISLIGRRDVLVRDEIETDEPVEVVWHLHTEAEVAVDGRRATLTQGSKRLFAKIVEPVAAKFTVAAATTQPPQRPLNDVRRLSVTLPVRITKTNLVVLLTPEAGTTTESSRFSRPLAR